MRLNKESDDYRHRRREQSSGSARARSGRRRRSGDPWPEAPTFEAGTTMAKLAEAGTITIGTKFDQPLFGLKGPDGNPVGFDVEIGKIIAAELGIAPDKIKWIETVSANREQFIENGDGRHRRSRPTRSTTSARKSISFAGPYYNAGQDILVLAGNPRASTGPKDLDGQERLHASTGSTSEKNIDEYDVEPHHDRHVLELPRAAAQR